MLLDLFIVLVLAVSVAAGVSRGGLRELLSLAGWLIAGVLTLMHFQVVSGWLDGWIARPALRDGVAALLILILASAVISLADMALKALLKRVGGDGRDPLLGLVVGSLRGLTLVVVAIVLAQRTALPDRQVWSQSQLAGHAEALALEMRTHLPQDMAHRLALRREQGHERRVVLPRDSRGHFVGTAYVNGLPVELLVDTGATMMMVPAHLAEQLGGLPVGRPFSAKTVTGEVVAHSTLIDAIKIGPIVLYDVEASLVPSPHDTVLLGMSVLNRLDFVKVPDGLVLEQGSTRPDL